MKKKISILLIILVTIACIYSGIRTREKNGIVVTQIQTQNSEALSYMLQTSKNNIIMIDGGSQQDSEHLEKILQDKGGSVEAWFITRAHPESFGAMKRILENEKIQVNHIYISFNEASWYCENESEKYSEIAEFLDFIYREDNIKKVYNVPLRYELLVDNLYFTVLNVANPALTGEFASWNQSMILKVNNTYKSMIFMGNIGQEGAKHFKDNNLDEIACDAVQIPNNGASIDNEIYQKMMPMYLFMPIPQKSDNEGIEKAKNLENHLKNSLKIKQSYVGSAGDVTVKIW